MSEAFKKAAGRILLVVLVIGIIAVAALMILAGIYTGDTIRKGITIEQADVSWLSSQDAQELVAKTIKQKHNEEKITLVYKDKKWDFNLKDIGYSYLVENAVKQAYYIGRTGNIFHKVYNALLLSRNGQLLEVEVSYDREKVKEILTKVKKDIDSIGKNAEISYLNKKISFMKETLQRNLDVDRNLKLVENQLVKRDFADIELVVDELKPKVLYDEIKVIDRVISHYSTKFNTSDTNRTDNIKLACNRINNVILLPGEAFSMNKALGPRTLENGYKEAPIIFKNELVQGTGGGVCQVSSTLYNTVLLAGLDVIEREHHSMTLSYISPGRDATITEDSIDFRFVNNLDSPVCLQASVKGNTLNISMLGKKRDDGLIFKLKSEVIKIYSPKPDIVTLDDTLQYGQKITERKAKKGIRVVLYREAYRDNKLQWRQKLTEDYYKPIQGKISLSSDLYQSYSTAAGIIQEHD